MTSPNFKNCIGSTPSLQNCNRMTCFWISSKQRFVSFCPPLLPSPPPHTNKIPQPFTESPLGVWISTTWRPWRSCPESCGAPFLEVLKSRLDGSWAAWAGGRQSCPWQAVCTLRTLPIQTILWLYDSMIVLSHFSHFKAQNHYNRTTTKTKTEKDWNFIWF